MAKKVDPGSLPEAVENFPKLPDLAYVRQPVVEHLFSISAATVWRRVRAGTLPKPRKFSERVTTWNVGELRAALNASKAA